MKKTPAGVAVMRERVKVKIIPCEVFSRVVGYYRPIQDWHKGKVDEFYTRRMIRLGQDALEDRDGGEE